MLKINNLSDEIIKSLNVYSYEVKEDVDLATNISSKELVQDLKQNSPKLTGDYKKGWRMKKVKNGYITYNKTDYQLTHLLEKSHAKRNGGRTEPVIHIAPAEEKAIKDFLKRIKKAIT